jgi:regulator of sirC expression with transglutaminase-like and TPR domain
MTFNDYLAQADPQLDLAAVALCIAADEYPHLDVAHYMECLAAHAIAVEQLLRESGTDPAQAEPGAILQALADHLFRDEGFSGNTADYYDPRNSFLNEVLDRRVGIPITLSIIYLEVGQRLGLSISPISFPAHFLLRVRVDKMDIVVDPFNNGAVLGTETLIQHLMPFFDDHERAAAYLPHALADSPRREVVARMLRNLKAIYASKKDWVRALRMSGQLISVDPSQAHEFRDRGHFYDELECPQAAFEDLERYLSAQPDASDVALIKAKMAVLRKQISRIN